MSRKLGYLAIDQYGERITLPPSKFLRKQLLDELGAKSARKVYVDDKDGKAVHIGYEIGGRWFTIYEVYEWKGPKR